jgi:hypothetical protein
MARRKWGKPARRAICAVGACSPLASRCAPGAQSACPVDRPAGWAGADMYTHVRDQALLRRITPPAQAPFRHPWPSVPDTHVACSWRRVHYHPRRPIPADARVEAAQRRPVSPSLSSCRSVKCSRPRTQSMTATRSRLRLPNLWPSHRTTTHEIPGSREFDEARLPMCWDSSWLGRKHALLMS